VSEFPIIGIIGLGNVGGAVAMGMSRAGYSKRILAFDRNLEKAQGIASLTGIELAAEATDVLMKCTPIFLSVRGVQVAPFIAEHLNQLDSSKILICLAAGVRLDDIGRDLQSGHACLLRAVTSVNAAVGQATTLLLSPPGAAPDCTSVAIDVLSKLGTVRVVESEDQLDMWSVLSGCTPAVTCLLLEGLEHFASEVGIDSSEGAQIAAQCVMATMAALRELDLKPAEYRRRVAAPGGVVEKAFDAPITETLRSSTTEWLRAIARGVVEQ